MFSWDTSTRCEKISRSTQGILKTKEERIKGRETFFSLPRKTNKIFKNRNDPRKLGENSKITLELKHNQIKIKYEMV